jgi:hypothetical protein
LATGECGVCHDCPACAVRGIRDSSALEIDPPELFSIQIAEAQIRKFKKTVLTDIEKAVSGAVMQVIERGLEELESSVNCENKPN